MCLEAGKPVALSSDAHVPDQLGHRYDEAVEMLRGMGVTEIADFTGRERRMVPLG
jgi:histidinol-phosphatase (PHP family)